LRDATHDDFIVRWANHVKTCPDWKREHTAFINAQFDKHVSLVKRLRQTSAGRIILEDIYRKK
jgi:hypothetical protein